MERYGAAGGRYSSVDSNPEIVNIEDIDVTRGRDKSKDGERTGRSSPKQKVRFQPYEEAVP